MNLSPLPIQKFFDNNGNPLVGGQLFTYVAGTSTKVATSRDQAGTANTNPVVLDYRGEANVWLDQTLTYKFVLAPAGDTDPPTRPIWTVDNISAAVTYASLTQQIIGQIFYPRTLAEIAAGVTPTSYFIPSHESTGEIYPERYSANNDTAIANALLVAAQLSGCTVKLRSASYTITSKKTIPNGTIVSGNSQLGTVVNVSGAIVGLSQEIAVHIGTNGKILVENIKFNGDANALGALLFDRTNYITVRHCQFVNFTAVGAYGIKLIEVFFHWINDNIFENIKAYGVLGIFGSVAGPNAGTIGPRNDFIGNNQAAFVGVSMSTTQNIHIHDNDFEGAVGFNGLNGIELIGVEGAHIHDNYMEFWAGPAIKINSGAASKRVLIEQNVLSGLGPVVDLANASVNDNIIVRQNRFADIGAGVTCINVGTTTNFIEYANDPNLGNITNTYTTSFKDVTRETRSDTGTLTGCATAPTAAVKAERIGNEVMLQIPTLTAVSTSTACTMTGAIDARLRPASNQNVWGRYMDNGVNNTGLFAIDTGGTITIYNNAESNTFFAPAGTKGFRSCTIIYSLN